MVFHARIILYFFYLSREIYNTFFTKFAFNSKNYSLKNETRLRDYLCCFIIMSDCRTVILYIKDLVSNTIR